MTGYTRQSSADILTGEPIVAAPLNAEFNQIQAAFNGTTGHVHDGTTGNGPKISLTSSVSGYLPAANGGSGGKNNTTATTAPSASNDTSEGYVVGSVWVNITLDRAYLCLDNSSGAAVWMEVPQIFSNVFTPHTTNTVDIGSSSKRFKDFYLAGTANIASLAATTASGELAMGSNKITGLGAPTASGDAATKDYVDTAIANTIDSAPSTLDTLNELAAALGDDPNFATTVTTSIGTKVAKAGDTMSGNLAMGNNKITGLGAPTLSGDATNKGYVDGILGSATAAATSASAASSSASSAATSATNAANSATAAAASASDAADSATLAADTVANTLPANEMVYASGESRDYKDRFKDTVSITEFLANETDDVGAALQAAIDASPSGARIIFPPNLSGTEFTWSSTVNVNKTVVIDFGGVQVNVTASLALNVTAFYPILKGGYFYGDRTAGTIFCETSSFRPTFKDMRIELFAGGFKHTAGYRPKFLDITMRNMVDWAIWSYDGVGPEINGLSYDTDGTWYGGSYAQPTKGAIWLQSEGFILDNIDIIHGGNGLVIEVPSHRNIEWGLIRDMYLDSCTGGFGIRLINEQSGRYMRGLWFADVWSATGEVGFVVDGTEEIDGIYFSDGCIHNNNHEAVYIDNSNAKNIIFNGTKIHGNSIAGTTPTIYVDGGDRINFINCDITGTANRWNTTAVNHVRMASSHTSDIDLSGSYIDSTSVSSDILHREPGATGMFIIEGVSGFVRKARGKSTIPAGSTSVVVNPGLNLDFSDENVLVTPGTGATQVWYDLTPPASSFTLNIPSTVGFDADFSWLVEVDKI